MWIGVPLCLLWIEVAFKLFVFGGSKGIAWILTIFTTLFFGSLIALIFSFFSKKIQRTGASIVLFIIGLYAAALLVYTTCLESFYVWEMLFMADRVGEFGANIRNGIAEVWWKIIILMIPAILSLLNFEGVRNKVFRNNGAKGLNKKGLAAIALGSLVIVLGLTSVNKVAEEAFHNMNMNAGATYELYGVGGATAININGIIFGYGENYTYSASGRKIVEGECNVTDIDFGSLIEDESDPKIRSMHEYFEAQPPTEKNEYTGYFEGKNLIFLTVESMCSEVVDPDLMPTLYRMYNEGFQFTNFYDPMWNGSTATGEYENMTGNFYPSGNCLSQSSRTYTYSALGNMFRSAGYTTYAYHNNFADYYDRDKSHPNYGYTFKAIGTGLDNLTTSWPYSDLEMAQQSIDDYIHLDEPWHAYYMTISGHSDWAFDSDDHMSDIHRDKLPKKFLKYSDNVQAYYAAFIEDELMLEYLVDELDKAGELENTVFAMCTDHYPYPFSDSELAELYGLPVDGIRNNPDLYRNSFILWSASMDEPVVCDKYCCACDIAPTLYNMFGLDYDSRIIIGQDIFSSSESYAIINTYSANGNWVNENGYYDARSGKFEKSKGADFGEESEDEYVERMTNYINGRRFESAAILDNDYYAHVFG